jgi:hypothetical protein
LQIANINVILLKREFIGWQGDALLNFLKSNPFSKNLKGHPFCHPINFLGMLAVFLSINWCYSMEISKLIIIPLILVLAWDCCHITKICKFFYHHSI